MTEKARSLKDYVVLPSSISQFERDYLARMNRVALGFFLLHPPVFALIAFFNGTGALAALAYTLGVLVGPVVAMRSLSNPRHVSIVMGVSAMLMGGLLVHFGQGPMQIEMHFYFFVLLALEVVFANPAVVVASAVTAALHHVLLFFLLPRSIFNYDATIWTVAVHALFVVLESTAACFVARSFFDDVIGLDELVKERTRELDARNEDLQLVLDHVEQGLVTIDLSGHVRGARSRAVDTWFGACESGESFVEAIAARSAPFAEWLSLGLEDVAADVLPRSLTLVQLPSTLHLDGRELHFEYLPITHGDPDQFEQLLVVVTDVTATRAKEAAETSDREFGALLERASKDLDAVVDFVKETQRLVELAARPDLSMDERKRVVHTVKGNTGIFGLASFVSICHAIESRWSEDGESESPSADVAPLVEAWSRLHARVEPFLRGRDDTATVVANDELLATVERVVRGESPGAVASEMLGWTREPIARRFDRVGMQLEHLSSRLGKPTPRLVVESDELRVPRNRWAPFWNALVHAVRNSVDHGLETAEERAAAGKPEHGTIALLARRTGDQIEVRLEDDGRGIDWDRVRAKAADRGLAVATQEDLVAAVFTDGLSTKEAASDVSGRGVGMSALRAACDELGGSVTVESTAGRGTAVIARLPALDVDLKRQLEAARASLMPKGSANEAHASRARAS